MFIQRAGVILRQNRNALNMGVAHIAQSKINAPKTSRDWHCGNGSFSGKFPHTLAVAAR